MEIRQLATLISLWVHVPFAVTWIGIVLFEAYLLLAPGLSALQRARLVRWSAPLALAAIPVLIATGIRQTIDNPVKAVYDFASLEELRNTTSYGLALFLKHGFVLASIALMLFAKFGPAARMEAAVLASAAGSRPGLSGSSVLTAAVLPGSAANWLKAAVPGSAANWLKAAVPGSAANWLKAAVLANVAACLGLLVCVVLMIFALH